MVYPAAAIGKEVIAWSSRALLAEGAGKKFGDGAARHSYQKRTAARGCTGGG
jgi:hypothetical protein